MRLARHLSLGLTAMLMASVSGPALAVTDEDLLKDHETTGDILTYGLGYSGQRYSPLDAINKDNVKSLVPAWSFSFGGEKQRGQESQPLIHDGVMYVTGSYSRMWAIDIATGEELWQYDARLPEGILPCCDVVNRGAAIYGDKIYFGTLDAKHCRARSEDRQMTVWRKTMIANYKEGYSYTAAPLIVEGVGHYVGNSGGEFGMSSAKFRLAYDADTGDDRLVSRPVH